MRSAALPTSCSLTPRPPRQFTNVTANLLYLYNVTIDGILQTHPAVLDALQEYFWNYDNNGLKLLQLRFYWCSTIVPVNWRANRRLRLFPIAGGKLQSRLSWGRVMSRRIGNPPL